MSAECSALNIPPGYKQTEVGVIPEDWGLNSIENLAYIATGGRNTQDHVEDGQYPFFVRSQTIEKINSYSFDGEAVLTAGDGVGTGKVFHYINGKFDFHQRVYRISDFKECINGCFFYLYFSSNFYNRIMQMTAKSSVDSVRREMIAKMLIPLPPKDEQETIAEALNDLDMLIESLERLITKKRRIKQGTMQELLTGKKRLPGFDGKWEMCNLRKFVRNFIVPMRDKPKIFAGNIPWCRIEDFDGIFLKSSKSGQHVNIETIKAMNLKVHPTGTLLVSCSADLGRCAIVARPLVSNQTFIGLEMDETVSSNLFFYYYMISKAKELNNLSSGTTISYLSREQFEEFSVLVPCDKKEQDAIATILYDMDSEIIVLEEKLAKALQIKQGMMQELLTGRIRLV